MSEALFPEREVYEAMSPQSLARFILQQSEIITEAERKIGMANDALAAYGTTIDAELDKFNEATGT